jgi:hypothetical protein
VSHATQHKQVGADALIQDALGTDQYLQWFIRGAVAATSFLGAVMSFGACTQLFASHENHVAGRGGDLEQTGDRWWGDREWARPGLPRPSPLDSFMIAASILSVLCLVEGVLWCLFRPIIGIPLMASSLVPLSIGALLYSQVPSLLSSLVCQTVCPIISRLLDIAQTPTHLHILTPFERRARNHTPDATVARISCAQSARGQRAGAGPGFRVQAIGSRGVPCLTEEREEQHHSGITGSWRLGCIASCSS